MEVLRIITYMVMVNSLIHQVTMQCLKTNVPSVPNAHEIYVAEKNYILYQCDPGYKFLDNSLSAGIMWCDFTRSPEIWGDAIIQCVLIPTEATTIASITTSTTTTTPTTTTLEAQDKCTAQYIPNVPNADFRFILPGQFVMFTCKYQPFDNIFIYCDEENKNWWLTDGSNICPVPAVTTATEKESHTTSAEITSRSSIKISDSSSSSTTVSMPATSSENTPSSTHENSSMTTTPKPSTSTPRITLPFATKIRITTEPTRITTDKTTTMDSTSSHASTTTSPTSETTSSHISTKTTTQSNPISKLTEPFSQPSSTLETLSSKPTNPVIIVSKKTIEPTKLPQSSHIPVKTSTPFNPSPIPRTTKPFELPEIPRTTMPFEPPPIPQTTTPYVRPTTIRITRFVPKSDSSAFTKPWNGTSSDQQESSLPLILALVFTWIGILIIVVIIVLLCYRRRCKNHGKGSSLSTGYSSPFTRGNSKSSIDSADSGTQLTNSDAKRSSIYNYAPKSVAAPKTVVFDVHQNKYVTVIDVDRTLPHSSRTNGELPPMLPHGALVIQNIEPGPKEYSEQANSIYMGNESIYNGIHNATSDDSIYDEVIHDDSPNTQSQDAFVTYAVVTPKRSATPVATPKLMHKK